MESAWRTISDSSSQKPASSETFSRHAAEEKYVTKRETEFVSTLASNLSKVSIFRDWQMDQLEGLVPMARLHSVHSNCVDEICFEDSNASNIILSKLSKRFDSHRKCCYPEYVRRLGQSRRTVLIVLDGELNIHGKKYNKNVTKGHCIVLSICDGIQPASPLSELHDSKNRNQEASIFEFGDLTYTSNHAFFLMLSDTAIESVARTMIISSKVEFSLHGDTMIRSQAMTLDALCHAENFEAKVFYPNEVSAASATDGTISIIVCGRCSQLQGENLAARLNDTCNARHIAETEELSLSQAIFFAVNQKRVVLNAASTLKQKNGNNTVICNSGTDDDFLVENHSKKTEISIFTNNSRISTTGTRLISGSSAGNCQHDAPTANFKANAECCVANPFMKTLPAARNDYFEGTLPQSPSVQKKQSKSHSFAKKSQVLLSETDKCTLSLAKLFSSDLHEANTLSCKKITKETAFWGYTPALQNQLSDAKFYWALIRLFVHSCSKKVRRTLRRGESLDITPICSFHNHGRKGEISHRFFTLSVVYTISCNQAVAIFNPFLHSISRVACWHNDLGEKPYFRSAENVEKLLAETCNLKCFSSIPKSTRRLIIAQCLLEEWPPGTLILSTVSREQRMCFMIEGDAAAFSSLQKDEKATLDAIGNDDDITHHYLAGEVLSQHNINLSYSNEPQKIEHVYAGIEGAKVLSVPQAIQEKLLKPLWDEEMKLKMRCFQASQLNDGFSEAALLKVLSQSRMVDIYNHQAQLEFSVNCIYLVAEGYVRVSGSAGISVNHNVGKGMMKDNFLQQNGKVSMVDSSSAPSKLENVLKRKLAASPKHSRSYLNFHVADMHSPHLFRVCSHDSDQKCNLSKCWKFAKYSCPLQTKVLEVQLQHLPQKILSDIVKASDVAHTRMWNLFLQIKKFTAPHLDTSSGHATISLETGRPTIQCKPLVKTRTDKLAVPFERFQVAQKACDFTIYSQKDPHQEVLDTAAELKAIQTARLKLSTIESLKLNRLSGPQPDVAGGRISAASSKSLELNSFLYDAAAMACPSVIHKEQTELRSISSQPRTSSLKLWSRGLGQMVLSVVEPSQRVLFLADKEAGLNKLSPMEESEFEEFCSVLKEKSQNPDIRDSRERRKFLENFGNGMLKSQAFVKATWCFDLQ